ncbi:hypothetical protein GQ54DRAFT_30881 [Martensiomyces pterosporus]|nr:hypothetical protein GQ54DRAFT_30881 [Martensiomyces pterosporus]
MSASSPVRQSFFAFAFSTLAFSTFFFSLHSHCYASAATYPPTPLPRRPNMLRGFLLTIIFILLALQVIASLFETGLYAAEKIYLEDKSLAYSRGWLFYFKWVVKPLSAGVSLVLLIINMCSCCCGGPNRKTGRGGRTYPSVLGFFSLVLTGLWAVIVGFQLRNNDTTKASTLITSTIQARAFVYPLGEGFSLSNDCSAVPFTLIDFGTTACKLLKAESGVAIACLGLWALTFVFSLFVCCTVRRGKNQQPMTFTPTNYPQRY